MANSLRILITTGDPDGIGWEVTSKALTALGPRAGVQFFFFRRAGARQTAPALDRRFHRIAVSSLDEAARVPFAPRTLIEIRRPTPAALWVEEAAKACLSGHFHALVTAPLSKTSIRDAGLKDIGHTEILARLSGTRELFMGFLGRKFSVVLATGHQPLREALAGLTLDKMRRAIGAAGVLRAALPPSRRRRPLAIVGVNPHAGEQGLLGDEEALLRQLLGADVRGPLVPDAAFLPANWGLYSVYVCPYHDQGLIPFKLVHGFDSGVHMTLGLPFIRTSVDHGTAKDIFGKNKARAGSMKDAITTAIRLAKEKFP